MNLRISKTSADDFFRLFVKREWKVIVGKKFSNLWLLTGMLAVTFLAISFSNASLRFLSAKMNDPFIKWVDIANNTYEGDFRGLELALSDEANMEEYDYGSYQSDIYFNYGFFGVEEKALYYFRWRFFEDFKSELIEAILDDDNVVNACKVKDLHSLSDKSIGIILSENALKMLGYDDAPAYLDLCQSNLGADSLGFKLYDDQFAHVPIPVLGVVKRLPSNVDVISTKYLYQQLEDDHTYPFSFGINHFYAESLVYFVPETVDYDNFIEFLESQGHQFFRDSCEIDDMSFYKPEIESFKKGDYVSLVGKNSSPLSPLRVSDLNDLILSQWKESGVTRVFDYNFSTYQLNPETSYLSVNFNSLDNIRDFERFVRNEFNVKIDMSQINSKENYNAVSIMGNVLSWAIIVLAIVCVVLFIVDLLKSYFQKVKKNIGTFKAFGVSNRRLTSIYALIVTATVIAAILISLFITFLLQESLNLAGIMKDGEYSYLSLGNFKTFASAVIIAISSVCTVYAVMGKLLKHTPGDIIYDR